MSILVQRSRPSFAQGFARSRGESAYPGLWPSGGWQTGLGPTGDTVHDASGNHNNAALTAMDPATDWVAGVQGHHLHFNGSSQYLEMPDSSPALTVGSGDFSVVMWIRTTGTSFTTLMGNRTGGGNGWRFAQVNATGVRLDIDITSQTSYATTIGTINDGVWHQLAISAVRTANVTFFLDGIEAGAPKDISAKTGDCSNSKPFGIGANSLDTSPALFFPGDVANAYFYKRAIMANEVAQLYADPWAPYRRKRNLAVLSVPAAGGATPKGVFNNVFAGPFGGAI